MSLSYAYNTVYFYIFVLYISTLEPVLCIDGVIFLFCCFLLTELGVS